MTFGEHLGGNLNAPFPEYLSKILRGTAGARISYGFTNSRTKKMLSTTREGALVFAKETDNIGVHDAHTNRDTATRVRSSTQQKEKRRCCTYFDRL